MNNIFFQSSFITETRSRASRLKTTAKKATAEHAKRVRTGKSIGAEGAGRRAGKELATSKVYKKGAEEFKQSAKEPVGSSRNPTPHSAGVLRKAAAAMERHSSLKRTTGERLISHGKSYKKNLQATKVSEGHKDLGQTKNTKLFGKSAAKNLALGNKTEFAKKVLGGMRLAGKLPFQTHGKRRVKKRTLPTDAAAKLGMNLSIRKPK